ncbi:MAG: Sulfurtransferase [Betaproteobacteria bacterium]|nr:Sulfurtransferase [Betaproteobacteria bacterium]
MKRDSQKSDTAPSALVDPAWLEQHLDDPDVVVIEIAGMGQEQMPAYKAGHIAGALGWDWKAMLWDSHARDFPTPGEFARRLGAAGIGNDTTVVFYGEPVQFGIYAWWAFTYCGHRNVKVLDGARQRWQTDGRALTGDASAPREAVAYAPVSRNENMRMGRDEVLAALRDSTRVILDGRSAEEYRGERVGAPGNPDTGALRYGRIPGAKHLMFEELLNADKSFKPREAMQATVEARGAAADKGVIAYCRMSHRATVLYFALTQLLGYDNVRVYDGSWTEWGNLVGVPVER